MINSRILLSAASIAAAASLMAGATFALFSDSGTSNTNVFASGTLDLKLTDSNETALDNVTASFGGTNLAPGACTGSQTLTLKNDGSINGNSVTVAATNSEGVLSPYLRLNVLTYNGSTVLPLTDSNANAWSDLKDLQVSGLSLAGITAGSSKALVMDVCLDSSAPNAVQGLSDTLDLTVTLNQ